MDDLPDGDSSDVSPGNERQCATSNPAADGGAESTASRRRADVAIPEDVIPRFERPPAGSSADPSSPEPAEPASETALASGIGLPYGVIPRLEERVPPQPSFDAAVLPSFDEPVGDDTIPVPGTGSPSIELEKTSEVLPAEERDDFGISGPEYDQEMPLADHIEEMIKRLAVVVVVAGSVTLVTFPFADQIINFLWFSILPAGSGADPRVYGPLEFLITQIKVASLMGLIIALPVIVYETYAFMRPGLYRHERRYYLAAIPTSLVLALIGVAFAYFIVLPALFTYFLVYSEDAGQIAFALGQTFDLMLILMAYLAIVFQIPLFIMLAIMMGLTTRRWLAAKRLYFWGAFLGLAFISSPDPTGMAPIIIALTMVALFEGTIGLLKWVGK